MDFSVSSFITLLSVITGLVSVLLTLVTFLQNRKKESKALEETSESTFVNAISSSNIKVLGNYLDNNLGNITVKEYSSNKKIQKKVNNYLQNIIDYLGTDEEIKKAKTIMPETEKFFNYKIPNELRPIINELRIGQPWNALAQLRRHIEITLRSIITENGIEVKEFIPATQMLSMLSSSLLIPTNAARKLKYSISICNKAVHGIDTTQEEAEEAIQLAVNALNEIKRSTT